MSFFRSYVILESKINPYEDDYGNMSEASLYSNNAGAIYLMDDSGECVYELSSSKYIRNPAFVSKLHPATRKEIKAAGLWDYVENKEDYSSEQDKIETELDEYLRIGEELERKAKSDEDKSFK